MSEPGRTNDCGPLLCPDLPCGNAGPAADRNHDGRFVRGNRAALVVGERSTQFWTEQEAARREIVTAVVADAGHTLDNAPTALRLAASGIAQALLLRDSAFARLVESGGPVTAKGRTRRAYAVWLSACDRLERHLRLVGLERSRPPATNLADLMAQHGDRR